MAEYPSWLSKWKRSPRQDRRVVENGVFVEQGKIHLPEPPAEEVPVREESALEIVNPAEKLPSEGTVFEEARHTEETDEPKDPVVDNEGASAPVADDGGTSQGGVQSPAGGLEGNSGTDGSLPEAEGAPANEAGGTVGRVPASDSVAPKGGQTVDAVAEHVKGSQTIAEIAKELTDEESDALAEMLRLPEPAENDVPF